MKAKLIAVTKPVVEGLEEAKDLIAFCARVSNPSNQFNMDTADKLVNYLVKHKHWSPLEMANCVVEVEAPRDIARQLLRHRSFSFQEFSQRYADVSSLGGAFVIRECRMQDTRNRQNSLKDGVDSFIIDENGDTTSQSVKDWWEKEQQYLLQIVKNSYKRAIDNGIAKEVARVILPEGLTMSRLYVNGSFRSWCHYLEVRTEEGVTQLEHVELAREIAKAVAQAFPQATNFVKEH